LQFSNPVDTSVAYGGNVHQIGNQNDPMGGQKIGGVNVFGGGLALYEDDGEGGSILLGAVGVSGDSSCADHNIAWRVRENLGLDNVPAGVHPDNGDDGIIYDTTHPFGHPTCLGTEVSVAESIGAGSDLTP
jgi:hypothetical protein